MFSLRSYFNRQSLTLIGLIIILITIPLTAMLAQKTQQLRQRAAPSGDVIFTDANGNPLGNTTPTPDVYLKIIPPDGWTLAQNPSLLPKTYAQEEACTGGWNSATCSLTDQSPCSDYGNQTYCGWDQSLWNACQNKCEPTPTSPPQPTATLAPTNTPTSATPTPTNSSCTPNGQIDTRRHCRPGTTSMCTYNVWRGSDCSTGEGDPYNCQDSSECGYQPPAGPTVLRQIYIQNKDGGSGGHAPARITGTDLNPYKKGGFLLVPWQLTDSVGQKSVQVDFYEQPDNDSAGRRTVMASIQLTQLSAPQPPTAGTDVADCSDDTITIDGTNYKSHAGIVVGTQYSVTIIMTNTKLTNVTTSEWKSNYSLRYVGGQDAASQLGLDKTRVDTNKSVKQGDTHAFVVTIKPKPISGEKTKYSFHWRMYNDKDEPFGGECKPEFTVFATAPGAPPGPTAEPGTCLAQSVNPPAQFSCVFNPSDLPSCLGYQERTGTGWASKSEFSCPTGKSCYYCTNISVATPTPPTPTPTPETLACTGTNVFCDSDVGVPRDPSQFNCQSLGRRACQAGTTCWRCTPITTTPTPTPTPVPGAPTPTTTPILPGSTVMPIRLAFQEFVKAPQTRIGQKPRRLTRPDVEVRLTLTGTIPTGFTAGQQFQTRTTLQWVEQRFDGNLGFFEGLTAFAPNTLPSGTNTYNVAVKEATHLRKTVATNVSLTATQQNQIVDGRNNILLVGSVDGDNTVDIVDHQILINCFGDKMTSDVCAGRGQDADLDDDGKVTIFDYNWLIENFGRTGDN